MSIAEPADAVEIVRLWPEGAPTLIDGVPPEVEWLDDSGTTKS